MEESEEELALLSQRAVPIAKLTETKQHSSNRLGSFIGGMPYFESGQCWPTCDHCGEPLNFIAQLAQKDHHIDFPSQWNLLVLFACGRNDWCLHRGRDGRSSRGTFPRPDWRAEGGTIAVHCYETATLSGAIIPEIEKAEGDSLVLEFSSGTSLPDPMTVECAPIRGYDPLNLHASFSGDSVRYARLRQSVAPKVFGSYIGGWPSWDGCADMTPLVDKRAMRHILQIDAAIGKHSFNEMACLFGDAQSNSFQLVYDGT